MVWESEVTIAEGHRVTSGQADWSAPVKWRCSCGQIGEGEVQWHVEKEKP